MICKRRVLGASRPARVLCVKYNGLTATKSYERTILRVRLGSSNARGFHHSFFQRHLGALNSSSKHSHTRMAGEPCHIEMRPARIGPKVFHWASPSSELHYQDPTSTVDPRSPRPLPFPDCRPTPRTVGSTVRCGRDLSLLRVLQASDVADSRRRALAALRPVPPTPSRGPCSVRRVPPALPALPVNVPV